MQFWMIEIKKKDSQIIDYPFSSAAYSSLTDFLIQSMMSFSLS